MNPSDTENLSANNKKKIGWIEISSKKYGGFVYRQQAREALAKEFDVELVSAEPRYLKSIRFFKYLESFFYLLRIKKQKDLWLRDYYTALFSPFKKLNGKNAIMVHHIDISGLPLISRPFLYILTKFFYHNLKKADAIITRAEIWRKYFIDRGYKNVYKIYGGFDLSKFDISDQEVAEFKKQNNLEGKPIIYIGNCQKEKGAVDSWLALRDLDVHLVSSGPRGTKMPILNFNLDYRDYLKLLKSSSIAITMSKFQEGWCRTAHEAMLCKTPTIGSGSGGMRELLEGGEQIICSDFKNLKEKVEYLLNNPQARKKIGEKGFNFAKNFTLEKFQQEWRGLVNKILK